MKKLSDIIASMGEPLLESFKLQQTRSYADLTKEQNIVAFELKERLQHQYSEIIKSVKHAYVALPKEVVESLLVDVIISNRDEIQ
jgi:hypothetical protein